MLARAQPWLGTLVAIRIRDGGACTDAHAACDAAFAAVARVQALMSFHDPASELSALNRGAARAPVAVSPWTYAVLSRALEVAAASAGAFDCAVAPALVRAGRLPAPPGVATPAGPPGDGGSRERLQLLEGGRVRYRGPLLLDLGGIAKGFAVDRALEALRDHGVAAATVNAGGDLRVFGACAETIRVRLPADPARVVPLVTLHDAALATSAHYPDRQPGAETGAAMTACIDPTSGACCGEGLSVSVVAPDCATADALTKVVAVSGDERHPALAAFGAAARVVAAGRDRRVRP
ncbi:MAG TPA: FAD:protein FMN transferase [Steroidobacteraceae bacterium]|nr:FAD:protein FMN transferase [Steroidobacteraceae bacterium]